MGYSRISLNDAERRSHSPDEPAVCALGYEIRDRGEPRPEKLRFNYFHYEKGEAVRRHRQREQEGLLFVVEGRVEADIDGETFTAETGDLLMIDPESWRRVTAITPAEIFAFGAPNVADDHIFEDEVDP